MIKRWYTKKISPFIFRKLNFSIALILIVLFFLIGSFTGLQFYNSFYKQEINNLETETQLIKEKLLHIIRVIKTESLTLHSYTLPQGKPFIYSTEEDFENNMKEKIYMDQFLDDMLLRNEPVKSILLFRMEDDKLFYRSVRDMPSFSESFDFKGFTDRIPRNFENPFYGITDGLFKVEPEQGYFYVINPIFDLEKLRKDNVLWYLMVVHDISYVNESLSIMISPENRVAPENEKLPAGEEFQVRLQLPDIKGISIAGKIDSSQIIRNFLPTLFLLLFALIGLYSVCFYLIVTAEKSAITRINDLKESLQQFNKSPLKQIEKKRMGNDEIGELADHFYGTAAELQDYISHVYIAEIERKNAEYYALKMQINPHFLYNTIESLRMRSVMSGDEELAEKLYLFGRLLRWILDQEKEIISLKEEMDFTSKYLELRMLGKDQNVSLKLISDEEAIEIPILKFILQPIIENALDHGQLEWGTSPVITIESKRTDLLRTFTIRDNGVGISQIKRAELIKSFGEDSLYAGEHLGLRNIHQRIRHHYGKEYGLTIPERIGADGFELEITVPAEERI